jgi:glycosyltransferase involved in cell wall biosynthesis
MAPSTDDSAAEDSQTMRIGLDILYEKPEKSTGTLTYLQGFLKALDTACGAEDRLFLFANPRSIDFCREFAPNYRTIILPFTGMGRPVRTLLQHLLIPLYARILKLDVINFLGTTGAPLTPCAAVQHVKTLHHYDSRESLDPLKVQYLKLMLEPSLRRAQVVIANSEYTKAGIIHRVGVQPEKIVVVHEAVDHTIFKPEKGNEHRHIKLEKFGIAKPYILFVSSLWRYKNFHTLIKAFSLAGIEHDLVAVGGIADSQYKKSLLNLMDRYGIRDRVKMVGHIKDRRVVRDFYTFADLYISPSLAETFGLTILEAMACGTPVVASNATSIPEVLGGAGLLFDPHDPGELARCIRKVLYDAELRNDLIRRGIERAQDYNWENTAKATRKAYDLGFRYSKKR